MNLFQPQSRLQPQLRPVSATFRLTNTLVKKGPSQLEGQSGTPPHSPRFSNPIPSGFQEGGSSIGRPSRRLEADPGNFKTLMPKLNRVRPGLLNQPIEKAIKQQPEILKQNLERLIQDNRTMRGAGVPKSVIAEFMPKAIGAIRAGMISSYIVKDVIDSVCKSMIGRRSYREYSYSEEFFQNSGTQAIPGSRTQAAFRNRNRNSIKLEPILG